MCLATSDLLMVRFEQIRLRVHSAFSQFGDKHFDRRPVASIGVLTGTSEQSAARPTGKPTARACR